MAFPLVSLVLAICFGIWWFFVCVYIFSVHKETNKGTFSNLGTEYPLLSNQPTWQNREFKKNEWDQDLQNSFAVHFFAALWNVQFIIYFTYLTLAGATAMWYFSD